MEFQEGDGDVKVLVVACPVSRPDCCPVLEEYIDTAGAHNEDTIDPHSPPWPASFVLEYPGPLDGKDETLALFGVPHPLPSFFTLHGARLGEASRGGGSKLPPTPLYCQLTQPVSLPQPPGPLPQGSCSCSYKFPRGHLIHSPLAALPTAGSRHQVQSPRGLGQDRRLHTNTPGLEDD